jgi:nitric-oxide synthase
MFTTTEAEILAEASDFFRLIECETGGDLRPRVAEVETELGHTGTYWQTTEELEFGSRVAWRNSNRCVGRLHWRMLQVRDMRHLEHEQDVFDAIVEHIRISTNGGKIRPLITVFAPRLPGRGDWRIWNSQLIRYAGYRQNDGSILGDPLNASLTDALRELGWRGEGSGRFDILPLAVQKPDTRPRLFELPPDVVLEVPISHPEFAWFGDLGLRWYALPAISDMRLEIGGVSYPAAAFSGWYMGTEVGARDLGDVKRYNMLPPIAEHMGLNTRSDRSLWRDRAIIELNVAVLHSFARHGVMMVDHHTACRQFLVHEKGETDAGRMLPAEWSWIVPPISGSTTPVFHRGFKDVTLKPNFFYQAKPWRTR